MKKQLKYFVSYAHKNDKLVNDFLDKLADHLNLSKDFEFIKWYDGDISVGDNWHDKIQKAIDDCDFGLLLLSASFFNSGYIKTKELPHFLSNSTTGTTIHKEIVPVGIEYFDLESDLLGLEALQIFRYKKGPGIREKFYSECNRNEKTLFVSQLVEKIIQKF